MPKVANKEGLGHVDPHFCDKGLWGGWWYFILHSQQSIQLGVILCREVNNRENPTRYTWAHQYSQGLSWDSQDQKDVDFQKETGLSVKRFLHFAWPLLGSGSVFWEHHSSRIMKSWKIASETSWIINHSLWARHWVCLGLYKIFKAPGGWHGRLKIVEPF